MKTQNIFIIFIIILFHVCLINIQLNSKCKIKLLNLAFTYKNIGLLLFIFIYEKYFIFVLVFPIINIAFLLFMFTYKILHLTFYFTAFSNLLLLHCLLCFFYMHILQCSHILVHLHLYSLFLHIILTQHVSFHLFSLYIFHKHPLEYLHLL